jgi:hypothetical protein
MYPISLNTLGLSSDTSALGIFCIVFDFFLYKLDELLFHHFCNKRTGFGVYVYISSLCLFLRLNACIGNIMIETMLVVLVVLVATVMTRISKTDFESLVTTKRHFQLALSSLNFHKLTKMIGNLLCK